MKKRFVRSIGAVVLAAVMCVSGLLTGCGKTADGGDSRDVVMQIIGEPDSLNPQVANTLIALKVLKGVNATLLRSENGVVKPYVAESYEVNDECTEYHFVLREDVYFHNGEKVTADDVAYTLDKGMGDSAASAYFKLIDHYEVLGENELTIYLNAPYSPFLNILTTLPFSILSRKAETDGVDLEHEPIGCGPFAFKSWVTNDSVTLESFDRYFEGKAQIDSIRYLVMSDENSCLSGLQAGDLDIATSIPASSEDGEGFQTVRFQDSAYMMMVLNNGIEKFSDQNVRLAINAAVNRDDIISVALLGNGVKASIPANENISGYSEQYCMDFYDLEKAKAYLADSRYPDGLSFSLYCYDNPTEKAAQIIQSNLAELGITVEIEKGDVNSVVSDMLAGNYEAGIVSLSNSSGDVDNMRDLYEPGAALNIAAYSESDIYDLFVKAAQSPSAQRQEILNQAYDLILTKMPYVPIYFDLKAYGVSERIDADKLVIDFAGSIDPYSISFIK